MPYAHMPATLIDGKGLADTILNNLKVQIDALGVPLHLAAVCVGGDAGLRSFVKLKQKAAQSVGIEFSSYFFDGLNSEEVRQTVQYLAADDGVHGIFIELPLPPGWDADALLALIPSEKDVDALTKKPLVPEPSVRALQYVFQEYGIEPKGMTVVVVGHGRLVGQPIAKWLLARGAIVNVVDEHTVDPDCYAHNASLVITGVGKPGLVTKDWVQEGATVIDFGYHDGKGDVDLESVQKKAGLLAPVPGGMGPLLIAAVLENLVTLATH
jgi:methylenetetrahydrofolate dehydrogenase (NADP+)/methenyltetrahydrofolate cyclohydrolase